MRYWRVRVENEIKIKIVVLGAAKSLKIGYLTARIIHSISSYDLGPLLVHRSSIFQVDTIKDVDVMTFGQCSPRKLKPQVCSQQILPAKSSIIEYAFELHPLPVAVNGAPASRMNLRCSALPSHIADTVPGQTPQPFSQIPIVLLARLNRV